MRMRYRVPCVICLLWPLELEQLFGQAVSKLAERPNKRKAVSAEGERAVFIDLLRSRMLI